MADIWVGAHLVHTHLYFAGRNSRLYKNTIIIRVTVLNLFSDDGALLVRKSTLAVNDPPRCSPLVNFGV